MKHDREPVRALYRRLLRLYPRAFQERLGESMEQTFADLCKERKPRTGLGRFGFLLRIFVETGIGIVRENARLVWRGGPMKNFIADLRVPAIISLLLVLPFMALEATFNIAGNLQAFSTRTALDLTVLFGILWLLPASFIFILAPVLRHVRAGDSLLVNPVPCRSG